VVKSGRVKVIRTRHIVEVYQYENMPVCKGGRTVHESENWEKNRKVSGKRKRDYVRRLIAQNFDSGSKFVTLTFRDGSVEDVRDVEACHRAWHQFTKRLRRRYPDVKALAVVEFQDANGRGAVHYHMICNLPYIPNEELAEIWGNGFIRINRIDHVDNVGAYVVKYMSKDVDDVRLRKRKAYYRVGRLEEPQTVWADDVTPLAELVGDAVPVYSELYGSEYHGRIRYDQYNLKRCSEYTDGN
jgi:hypothetical protein